MATWPILSVTTFLPLVGAVFILLLRGGDEAAKRNARWAPVVAEKMTKNLPATSTPNGTP